MALFITALVMGGIGSLHCVGMCGPLALSLPLVDASPTAKFISSLLYNAGRIVTYAMLGAVLGLMGSSVAFFGYQQWLSIALGTLILVYILFLDRRLTGKNYTISFFNRIRQALGVLFKKKTYGAVFLIGLLNGLLPCGLVYMAIAGAVSTTSMVKGSFFMASFGFGTLPMMWGVAFFGSFISLRIRSGFRKLYPVAMMLMAVLLILRGLDLGIPYVSPSVHHAPHSNVATIECHN
ncbi:MAG: sulfite exporter TauE/SafE family protein [Bacteroidetes bacterium]|nr:sulfite exporter TauE/SafE family protein [Bacteroidota bacterium]